MSTYTLEEIRSRLTPSAAIDFETEQALAFVADLTGEIRSTDPVVPLEVIGRAIQFRPEWRRLSSGPTNLQNLSKEDDWTVLLIRDWEEREANRFA